MLNRFYILGTGMPVSKVVIETKLANAEGWGIWKEQFSASLALNEGEAQLIAMKEAEGVSAVAGTGVSAVLDSWKRKAAEDQLPGKVLYSLLVVHTVDEALDLVVRSGAGEQCGPAAWRALMERYGRSTQIACAAALTNFQWAVGKEPETVVHNWFEVLRRAS